VAWLLFGVYEVSTWMAEAEKCFFVSFWMRLCRLIVPMVRMMGQPVVHHWMWKPLKGEIDGLVWSLETKVEEGNEETKGKGAGPCVL
jgi:hypothetical protein